MGYVTFCLGLMIGWLIWRRGNGELLSYKRLPEGIYHVEYARPKPIPGNFSARELLLHTGNYHMIWVEIPAGIVDDAVAGDQIILSRERDFLFSTRKTRFVTHKAT